MRILILLPVAASLVGCTYERIAADPIGPCRVEAAQVQFAGAKYRSEMRDHLQRVANARVLRVVRPDDMLTQDYNRDRLNVTLDDNNRIAGLRCG